MAKKTLKLRVDATAYQLRLTMGGQKRLKQQFEEDTLQTLLTAAADGARMAAVLEEALSWDGNENEVRDGEAFYDLLVDSGWAGQEQFAGLCFDLAAMSGLMTEQECRELKRSFASARAGLFTLEEVPEEVPEERPFPMAEKR